MGISNWYYPSLPPQILLRRVVHLELEGLAYNMTYDVGKEVRLLCGTFPVPAGDSDVKSTENLQR